MCFTHCRVFQPLSYSQSKVVSTRFPELLDHLFLDIEKPLENTAGASLHSTWVRPLGLEHEVHQICGHMCDHGSNSLCQPLEQAGKRYSQFKITQWRHHQCSADGLDQEREYRLAVVHNHLGWHASPRLVRPPVHFPPGPQESSLIQNQQRTYRHWLTRSPPARKQLYLLWLADSVQPFQILDLLLEAGCVQSNPLQHWRRHPSFL